MNKSKNEKINQGGKKQDIIDFLNNNKFDDEELDCIWKFVFNLYTGDLDLMEDKLDELIVRDKNNYID